MKLLSVNVSLPQKITVKGKVVRTGIFKKPVQGRVKVSTLNIEGDGQADLKGHGGPFRAVYVYSFDNYAYWERELKRTDFSWGQFGENLTVEGMGDEEVHVGDTFRIGTALFQVTQPRIPCYKLAIKMGVEGFHSRILKSGRLGFYFRVLEEGDIGPGDVIERIQADPIGMTILEVNQLMYYDKDNLESARRSLDIEALSPGWRTTFEGRLEKAETSNQENLRTLIVDRKEPESETITSFYLIPEDGKPLQPFLPGQFLPLKLDIPGQYQPVVRTYTLSDSPIRNYYRLTIKKEPAPPDRPDLYPGVASTYFHDQVTPGSKLLAQPPRGEFSLDLAGKNPVVLLSAGVGLTPMISMLNALVDSDSDRPIWFVHGSRNSREHAMGSQARQLAEENSNLQVHVRYSQPLSEDIQGRDYKDQGYVDIELLADLLPDNGFDFFLCGPTPFMKSLFRGLLDWGVSESRIHYEFFGPASALKEKTEIAPATGAAKVVQGDEEIAVAFSQSAVSAHWDPSLRSILDLAEAQGLNPDFSCRSGICNTCICRLEEGEVEYILEPLETPGQGWVLICCSKPKTDVVVAI